MTQTKTDEETDDAVSVETRRIMDISTALDVVVSQLFQISAALDNTPEKHSINFRLALLPDVGDLTDAINAGDEYFRPGFKYDAHNGVIVPAPVLCLFGNRSYFNNYRSATGEKDLGFNWYPCSAASRSYFGGLNKHWWFLVKSDFDMANFSSKSEIAALANNLLQQMFSVEEVKHIKDEYLMEPLILLMDTTAEPIDVDAIVEIDVDKSTEEQETDDDAQDQPGSDESDSEDSKYLQPTESSSE